MAVLEAHRAKGDAGLGLTPDAEAYIRQHPSFGEFVKSLADETWQRFGPEISAMNGSLEIDPNESMPNLRMSIRLKPDGPVREEFLDRLYDFTSDWRQADKSGLSRWVYHVVESSQ